MIEKLPIRRKDHMINQYLCFCQGKQHCNIPYFSFLDVDDPMNQLTRGIKFFNITGWFIGSTTFKNMNSVLLFTFILDFFFFFVNDLFYRLICFHWKRFSQGNINKFAVFLNFKIWRVYVVQWPINIMQEYARLNNNIQVK